jgi:hypothetical protein
MLRYAGDDGRFAAWAQSAEEVKHKFEIWMLRKSLRHVTNVCRLTGARSQTAYGLNSRKDNSQ